MTVVVTAKERNVSILETIYVEHFTGNVRTKKMKKVKGISRHKHSAVLRQMTTETGNVPYPSRDLSLFDAPLLSEWLNEDLRGSCPSPLPECRPPPWEVDPEYVRSIRGIFPTGPT